MNLTWHILERTWRGVTPAPTITAPDPFTHDIRGLSDNRDRYIQQSANTINGCVAQPPERKIK